VKYDIPGDRDSLPYVFDLLYDIKTVSSLYDHLLGVSRLATSATDIELLELMRDQNIAPPPGMQYPPLAQDVVAAVLQQRYGEAITLLKHLARKHGPMGEMEKKQVATLLKAHGLED
jgi:hypothetical protein